MSLTWRELCRELINSRGADYYRTLERARKALADEPEPASVSEQMPLSPAAQAIRKAYYSTDDELAGPALAAALRAAADRVEHHWDGAECVDHLQVIAAELEAHDG